MSGELTPTQRGALPVPIPVPQTGTGAWRLDVVSGPNRDASLLLPPGLHRIGAAAEDDIMLADPAAGAPRVSLSLLENGEAELHAEAAGARFRERPVVPGRRCRATRGGDLRLGRSVLRLTPPPGIEARRQARRETLRWRIGAVLGAVAIIVGLGAFGPRLLSDAPSTAPVRTEAAARAPARPDPAAARAALAGRLEAAGLGPDRLRVGDGAGGALLVEGRLSAEETARFAEVRRWYDAAHGAGPALVPRLGVDIAPPRPALRIRAVSLAPVPYLIASDGEKYGEGAVLEDGWVIESIDRAQVVLRRGSETAVVTL
ncbi:EscD/YscD/HrpQ family type III secretion system periplasmic domain-containing protein [Pararoseomonas sp. SCSIO 73927]|uniref:SctD/MshK family protein n=1 Tax=Pararoseomonas sp. SCSIO 73927 TaxID=3114537 RepID=UPI0030CBE9EE